MCTSPPGAMASRTARPVARAPVSNTDPGCRAAMAPASLSPFVTSGPATTSTPLAAGCCSGADQPANALVTEDDTVTGRPSNPGSSNQGTVANGPTAAISTGPDPSTARTGANASPIRRRDSDIEPAA